MLNIPIFVAGVAVTGVANVVVNKIRDKRREKHENICYQFLDGYGFIEYEKMVRTATYTEFYAVETVADDALFKKLALLEKTLGVETFVKDVPYSKTIKIVLMLKQLILSYKPIKLSPYQLLLGYDYKGDPLVVDMMRTAHLGVAGGSLNGKSICIETALANNVGADKVLINVMDDDFKRVKAKRINEIDKILEFLNTVMSEGRRERPLFIVIDEYNVLSRTKGIDKAVQDLLSQARHYNIFLIVIMQLGNKEDCKFKTLLNARISFRCTEEATLRAFVGSPVNGDKLQQQDFWLYHTELVKGRSYNV